MAAARFLLVFILVCIGSIQINAVEVQVTDVMTEIVTEPDRTTAQPPTDIIMLTCGKDFMSVTIPKSLLVDGVQGEDLTFKYSQPGNCYGEIIGDDVVLNTNLTGCGTTRKESQEYEFYLNEVVNSETKEEISRQYKVEIPVNCSYSRSGRVSQAWYKLTDYILDKDLEDSGKYSFDLKFYTDSGFTDPILGYPYLVDLNEELYFAATLGSEVYSDLDLSIKSCKATNESKYENEWELHYDLIKEWKVQDKETNLGCYSATPANQDTIRVITHAFRFVELGGNHGMVYIHCELFVCDHGDSTSRSVCQEQCNNNTLSARRRRDISLDSPLLPIQRLTRGPIRFRRAAPVPDELPGMQIQGGGNPDLEMSTPITMWGLVAVVMGAVVIVLLAALIVTLRKLAATTKTAETRKNDEESARLLDEDSD